MPRLLRFRALAGLLLILLTVQSLGAAAYAGPPAQPSGARKLLIDASDTAAIRMVAQAGGVLLADYGSFALWRTGDSAARSLSGRPTVAAPTDFDTIFLRSGALDTRSGSALPVPND